MNLRGTVRRYPLIVFFGLAYTFSIIGLIVIGLPDLSGKTPVPSSSFVMFPLLVVGVGVTGLVLTALTAGVPGVRDLLSAMRRWRLGQWALAFLIPPLGITGVLLGLRLLGSSAYAQALTPGFVLVGLGIGLVAGFFEEIGWTGFAYTRMSARFGALGGALVLGTLWGIWHFPVVDSLGAASPHGRYLPEFFAAFVAAMIAMRVLIAWLYTNTGSVLAAQLLHAISTASLVALSAPHVSAAQEALWYGVYAALLWVIVAVVVARFGFALGGERRIDASVASVGRVHGTAG
jgi:membrane protease YdiL (CAAX protease family)